MLLDQFLALLNAKNISRLLYLSICLNEIIFLLLLTLDKRCISTLRTPLLSKLRFSNSARRSITRRSSNKRLRSDIAVCYFKRDTNITRQSIVLIIGLSNNIYNRSHKRQMPISWNRRNQNGVSSMSRRRSVFTSHCTI